MKRHPDGYGFLISDDPEKPDLFISKRDMQGIMTNDRIEAKAAPDGTRFRGINIKMLEHTIVRVTGRVHKSGPDRGFMVDESYGWGEDLKVSWRPHTNVQDKDFVTVKITSYPESMRGFQGEVEHVIGDIGDASTDNLRVLSEQNIPVEFSEACIRESKKFSPEISEADKEGRKDIQDMPFITIDGATAKDFDDAILVEKTQNGFRLLVAIADVSHYVKEDTAIDKDAYSRGNSTYFPNFVAPMLPEILSNELCSLRPNTPRLGMVADMQLGHDGELKSYNFYEAVIKSHSRVTYGEAQECIDGNTPEKHKHVEAQILLAADLAKILMKRRFSKGSMNLELHGTVIELDEVGEPVDILRDERLFAHRVIEEMMLMANIATARFLDDRDIPALYRVHEEPKLEALELLEQYLMNFGYRTSLKGSNLQKKISEALEEFAGTPQQEILNILTLRSMKQAKYQPENVGHFGLGFSHYAHFTSPIRRYPDLIVHRLVKSAIISHKGYQKLPKDQLQTAGTMLSACEQRSVKGERKIHAIKKARFLHKHLGEEFEGFVSSVTKFGAFIVLKQFDIDGLIRLEDLGFDHFDFDEDLMSLVGRNSGMQFKLGDPVRVQVAAADIESGRIDFVLASGDDFSHGSQSKESQSFEKRRSSEDDRGSVRKARVPRPGGKGKPKKGGPRKARSRRPK